MAHIGVPKVLEEEKIPIDLVAGTSAGAILRAAYCGGLSARELEAMACLSLPRLRTHNLIALRALRQ